MSQIARVTINSTDATDPPGTLTLSASGQNGPNQVQWQAPHGTFKVQFPSGVFKGGAVNLTIKGASWQPVSPKTLLSKAKQQEYPGYIQDVSGAARAASSAGSEIKELVKTNPPIIIVKA